MTNSRQKFNSSLLNPSCCGGRGNQVAAALPGVLDKAWTSMGGGPSDLVFPDEFLGQWEVASTLIKVDLPCGPEFVPDLRVSPS